MVNELGYVATVLGWFGNNYRVLNDNYNRSADILSQAVGDVDFAATKSVTIKWLEMGGDIASNLAGFIPGGPGIQLIIQIIMDTYAPPCASDCRGIATFSASAGDCASRAAAHPAALGSA